MNYSILTNNNLNDKQILAVQNTEGFVRVIAGAGSGKTKLQRTILEEIFQKYELKLDYANNIFIQKQRKRKLNPL